MSHSKWFVTTKYTGAISYEVPAESRKEAVALVNDSEDPGNDFKTYYAETEAEISEVVRMPIKIKPRDMLDEGQALVNKIEELCTELRNLELDGMTSDPIDFWTNLDAVEEALCEMSITRVFSVIDDKLYIDDDICDDEELEELFYASLESGSDEEFTEYLKECGFTHIEQSGERRLVE